MLLKFGVEIDLNIAKRVPLLKPKPGVDFQLHMVALFKIFEIDMTSYLGREWYSLDEIW